MRTSTSSVRWAASITVLVAVGMDILAGADPLHIVMIGAIAVVVGVIRAALAGNCRGFFAFLSGVTVAQPTLHAAFELAPRFAGGHMTGVAAPHLALAAIVVLTVTASEQLLDHFAEAGGLAVLLWLLSTPHRPERSAPVWRPQPPAAVGNPAATVKTLRGPPPGVFAPT